MFPRISHPTCVELETDNKVALMKMYHLMMTYNFPWQAMHYI